MVVYIPGDDRQISEPIKKYAKACEILLMEEILHHLRCMKPCKKWDIYHIN